MNMKTCIDCKNKKPLEDFYKHPEMSDGHLGCCKNCMKHKQKLRVKRLSKNKEWLESERARHREKSKRLSKNWKKPTNQYRKRMTINYRVKYPEKAMAHSAVQHIKCKKGFEKHHWSYFKEHCKDVIVLSIGEHSTIHRFIIYDQERLQFRRCDTMELLDTKKTHEKYIKNVLENL